MDSSFQPILHPNTKTGYPCRMDNGEACFILSSRNEVDRTAAVSEAMEGHC